MMCSDAVSVVYNSSMGNHKQVMEEHAQLDVLLRDLRVVSVWSPHLLQDEKVRSKLAMDLASLRIRLMEHFETEESGSYMEEICSRKPSAGETLQSFHLEHKVFLQLVDFMENVCGKGDLPDSDYGEMLRKMSWLLDILKAHEQRETALIKEVFEI